MCCPLLARTCQMSVLIVADFLYSVRATSYQCHVILYSFFVISAKAVMCIVSVCLSVCWFVCLSAGLLRKIPEIYWNGISWEPETIEWIFCPTWNTVRGRKHEISIHYVLFCTRLVLQADSGSCFLVLHVTTVHEEEVIEEVFAHHHRVMTSCQTPDCR